MRNPGITIATVLLVVALLAGGYFAMASLNDPASYVAETTETIGDLHDIVTNPAASDARTPIAEPNPTPAAADPKPSETASTSATSNLQSKIQRLIDQKVTLKVGSKGANVGTIQEFMNLYLKKNSKIDNDFGKVLEGNVKTFQSQNKITATGQVASQTLAKMLEWLKNND